MMGSATDTQTSRQRKDKLRTMETSLNTKVCFVVCDNGFSMWKKSPQRVLSYYQLRGLVVQVNHLRFFPVIYDLLGASVRKITCVTLA